MTAILNNFNVSLRVYFFNLVVSPFRHEPFQFSFKIRMKSNCLLVKAIVPLPRHCQVFGVSYLNILHPHTAILRRKLAIWGSVSPISGHFRGVQSVSQKKAYQDFCFVAYSRLKKGLALDKKGSAKFKEDMMEI